MKPVTLISWLLLVVSVYLLLRFTFGPASSYAPQGPVLHATVPDRLGK